MGPTRNTTRLQWSLAGPDGLDRFPVPVTCDDPHAFRSRGTRWTFGDAILSDTVQSPCTIPPTDDDSPPDDSDYVSAIFVLSGCYRLVDTDQQITFDTGTAGWIPGWLNVTGECTETSRVARVSVPRTSLQGADHGHPPMGRFDGPTMLTTPALAFVMELMNRADEPSSDDGGEPAGGRAGASHPTSIVLSQLISGMFREQRGSLQGPAGQAPGLWAAAARVIDREFRDIDLDPVAVAARLHISLRHLQRAFAQNGSTIGEAIRDRRAEAAAAALAGNGRHDLSLGGVAAASGFSSIKEMRLAVRARHGMTPRELRSASTAAGAAATTRERG
ncbi:MAG: hypothetical protein JWR01_1352 [Subtercola sp.]|nr:hypothetical protein [Subtercola sp.]